MCPKIIFGKKSVIRPNGEAGERRRMKVVREIVKRWYPLLLSIIIPGFGQLVKGQWKKVLSLLVLFFLLYYFLMYLLDISLKFGNFSLILYYITQNVAIYIAFYLWQLFDVCINTIGVWKKQSAFLPAVLSFVLPGLGQLFNRQIIKGLIIMVGIPFLIGGIFFLFFQVFKDNWISSFIFQLVMVCWSGFYLWQVFDAYDTRSRI